MPKHVGALQVAVLSWFIFSLHTDLETLTEKGPSKRGWTTTPFVLRFGLLIMDLP